MGGRDGCKPLLFLTFRFYLIREILFYLVREFCRVMFVATMVDAAARPICHVFILLFVMLSSHRAGPLRKRSSSTVPVPVISEEYFDNPEENLSTFVLPPFTREGIGTSKKSSH